ncbi:hypothetical protein NPX13_g8228 [Xylaria arbuscula]|uniref:MaoC-like domain-containing protein n=1 Tax=Xylaria arbuscula TaxID=114810 RepID=A0A9W8N928_9PEZI|nr:hypothetical protein NPX13_g8228 [Xylaria arbuscula]
MWAGGSLQDLRSLKLNRKAAACVEKIADVRAQGPAGSEKIFVEVERNYIYPLSNGPGPKLKYREKMRRFLKNPSQNGRVGIAERRTLVFMREPSDEEKKISLEKEQKILRPPFTPTYSVTLTPTPTLLFHYSALSYNAHRIHLDRSYCREVEGYRDLLVHGPLSLTLMLSVLQSQLPNGDTNGSFIDSVDYRHLAPLYVNQPMRVCCAPRSGNVQDQWSIWVENQDGGLCVMGTAIIKPLTDSKQNETEN